MRRRYYNVKKVYPKQKWLPNIQEIPIDGGQVNVGSARLYYNTVSQNISRTGTNAQGVISGASILKVGRIRYKGNILTSVNGLTYIIGISYLPEGYYFPANTWTQDTLGDCFFYKHPEWLMGWTRIDYNSDSQRNEFSISSRLKRNLNSGDSIIVFVLAINNTEHTATTSNVNGTVSYVCRTN